jgi:AcrR family transcriptional regulator
MEPGWRCVSRVTAYICTECKFAIGKFMTAPHPTDTQEGLRSRKRRETRGRISSAALALFLEKGFEATTVDEIAAAADVSKRSFFDYFPSKEELISAWQDEFGLSLAEGIAARPPGEPMTRTVELALTDALVAKFTPRSMAIGKLIHDTPALRSREHTKYARLEQCLCEALALRYGPEVRQKARLLAMVAIGGMRVAGEAWQESGRPAVDEAFIREIFRPIWAQLIELGREGGG